MATPDLLQTWQPGVFALGRALVEFLWQGAAIAAVYAAARMILTRPGSRLFAGHLALLALALAPIWTLLSHFDTTGEDSGAMRVVNAVVAAIDAPAPDATPTWPYWLVSLWIAGVLGLSLRLWSQWRQLQRLCRHAVPMEPEWQQRFDALRRLLGVHWRARLRGCAQVSAPMLIGVLRPTILLPASLVARLPTDQIELILLHELAHLRRFDPIFNFLQTGIVTLLFYHPAVHWISRKVREDRELCCDEDVIAHGGDRLRYARVLLTLAEQESEAMPAAALAASGGALLQRVEHVVHWPASRDAPAQTHAQSLIVLGLAALLALVWWMPRRVEADRVFLPQFAMVPTAVLTAPLQALTVGDIAPSLALPRLSLQTDAAPEALPEPLLDAMVPSVHRPAAAAEVALPQIEVPTLELAALTSTQVPQAEAEPRMRVEPEYPAAARVKGTQGWVELSYRIDAQGRSADIAIETASPAGVFEQASIAARQQWRFDLADADGGAQRVRFDFVLQSPRAAGSDKSVGARCQPRTGTRLCSALRDTTVVMSGN